MPGVMTTDHELVGAIVRATNRTYGLRPAQPLGEPETVIAVDSYNATVETAEGNRYMNGGYLVMRKAQT